MKRISILAVLLLAFAPFAAQAALEDPFYGQPAGKIRAMEAANRGISVPAPAPSLQPAVQSSEEAPAPAVQQVAARQQTPSAPAAASATPATFELPSERASKSEANLAVSGERKQPDTLVVGGGYFNFDKDEPKTQSADVRLEYRFGYSLWSANNSWLDFQIHPLAAFEMTTRDQVYAAGGFAFDLLLWDNFVITESETVGYWHNSHNAKSLGSFIEFRSQIELGWRFDNDMRLTAQLSHISNAGITKRNPGAEIFGGYIHIPLGR